MKLARNTTRYERIVLERIAFNIRQAISKYEIAHLAELLEHDGMSVFREPYSDSMAFQLMAHVWCKDKKTERHTYPETWWDAVKQRWFPAWALKRWPPRMMCVAVDTGILYPTLPTLGPGVGYGEMYIYRVPLTEDE